MEKKKFHETQVGKFLLNKIPGVVSAIAGSTPVGSVIEAIIGGSGMNDQDKQVALEKLKLERAEMDGTTKRWVADAKSGFWLTSNVRPLILILITVSIISGFFLKYDISSLTQLGQVIFSAYFGSRGLEKVFGNKMHK
jgi:hypothetical protein|tara:strand:- start:1047 stop:1460 length:414 start_codon:yes stop_codon:yes gene_type:complete